MGELSDESTVRLRIPAKPEYVSLARLALSAVCRITPLAPADVADLKLAVTEAAAELLGAEQAGHARESLNGAGPSLDFTFELAEGRLVVDVRGEEPRAPANQESELSRAIVEATVDEWDYAERATRLVKYL